MELCGCLGQDLSLSEHLTAMCMAGVGLVYCLQGRHDKACIVGAALGNRKVSAVQLELAEHARIGS